MLSVGTYRRGEINRCQGKTRRLVDVPQEWASFDSMLHNVIVFRARGVAESPLEKGVHMEDSNNLSLLVCEKSKM